MLLNRLKQQIRKVLDLNNSDPLRNKSIVLNLNHLTDYHSLKTMQSNHNLKPPDHVAGLTTLNKSLFEKAITVPCLKIKRIKTSSIMPVIRKYLLKMENFKPVENQSDNTMIYLNPEKVSGWDDLEPSDQEALKQLNIDEASIENKLYTLCYENYSADVILKSVLPKDKEGTSSYTKIGHIVHVNLREHLYPYKDLIGQVLLEKIPGCRTVVNKVDMIDNTYRNFKMEILRGDNCMFTKVKENKCVFEFDFSKVYWNSRLCTEHERIVKMVHEGDVFFDVFAGVGPFSLPIAKKGGIVFANDLNPESFKWLEHNRDVNKIDKNKIKCYNKDGKDFVREEIKEMLPEFLEKKSQIYICMNLPALAVKFLPYFVNLYEENSLAEFELAPLVIVYCFTKGEDYVNLAKELLFKNIGCDINNKIIDIFRVRTVSSLKEMMRITFKLDRDILTGSILKRQSNKRKTDRVDSNTHFKKCNYGEEQAKEGKWRVQGGWSEEFETQSQGEGCQD